MPDKSAGHNEDWGLTLSPEEDEAMDEAFARYAEEHRGKQCAAERERNPPPDQAAPPGGIDR